MNLPLDLYSSDQLSQLILEFEGYINALGQAKTHAKVEAKSRAEQPMPTDLLQVLFDKNNVATENTAELDKLLKILRAVLDKAPIAHLTLSALPTRMYKRQLTVWFRTQINPNMLLTFTERRDIGGGLIARVGSHVYDFSFRRMILDNKQRISELVNV